VRPARIALAVLGSGLALTLGAGPAVAAPTGKPFPKPTPPSTAIDPGKVTRDPSTAQRSGAMAAAAQQASAGVADTPLMGWSSWSMESSTRPGLNPDGGGSWLTQDNLLKQVDAVAKNLKPYGYQYINIDAGWSRDITGGGWDALHFDANGREIASPQRFPDGMKPVADYIHSKGLKAGIYLAVGLDIPAYNGGRTPIADAPGCTTGDIVYPDLRTTNGWDIGYKIDFSKPCAQKYIDSQAALIASWGFDFLKLDGVGPGSFKSGDNYNNVADVQAWKAAIAKSGRPIRFLISWSLDRGHAADWKANSNGWRIDTDVECYCNTLVTWNNSVKIRWDDVPAWQPWAGPGGWNDLDSLDVGNGEVDGLSPDERRAYMTLWAISAAPLYTGDDVTQLDAYGKSLLTNREVIALDQQGVASRPVTPNGTAQVWGAPNKDGSYTVALFNMGSFPAQVSADWTSLGFSGRAQVRDMWAQRTIGSRTGGISATIPAHGAMLYRVTPAKHSGTGVTAYEAESPANAVVNGAAPADCANCSGGRKVGNLYNGGALQFRNVKVSRGGTYQVNIRYVSGDPRSATVSANGQSPVTLAFPSSGAWDRPATATVPLDLHAGTNTVEIDSSSAVYSPDVDRLEVPVSPR
jgi:alpha galactosidase A-like protein/alpha galactosidase C-like protein/carbohydrate binding protein with CBM6 domain